MGSNLKQFALKGQTTVPETIVCFNVFDISLFFLLETRFLDIPFSAIFRRVNYYNSARYVHIY